MLAVQGSKSEEKHKECWAYGAPIVAFALPLIIYIATLSPTINSFDSAEFITAAYTLGIVHSPGYPLYLILAHVAALLPWGSVARNVNFLSALFSSSAALFIYLTAFKCTRKVVVSLFSSLLFSFSRSVWSLSVIAEVYTLAALLISALNYMLVLWLNDASPYWLYGIGLLAGLNAANHLSSIFFFPGLVMAVVVSGNLKKYTTKDVIITLFFAAIPLLLYGYLPLRFIAQPEFNLVSSYFDVDLSKLSGILWMVTGRMLRHAVFSVPLAEGVRNIVKFVWWFWQDLVGVGLIFAAVGLFYLQKMSKAFFYYLLDGFMLTIVFFAFYDVIDVKTMFLPALVGLIPALAVGTSKFSDMVVDHWKIKPWIWLILIIPSVIINWSYADRSDDFSAYDFAERTLNQVEQDAYIVSYWTSADPLIYMHIVEDRRPDVEIFDRGAFVLGQLDELDRSGIKDAEVVEAIIKANIFSIIRTEMRKGRPVYITENDPYFYSEFCLVDVGNGIYKMLDAQNAGAETCINETEDP